MRGAADLPARHVLRAATQAVHERLHHLPGFAALASGTLGLDAYVALLGRLYGFHAPLERDLASALDPAPDGLKSGEWRRAHLLREDLDTFGTDPGGFAQWQAPYRRWTANAAMGSLYVLVGSTLGGRVLARQLGGILPGRGDAGRLFLAGGQQPGQIGWTRLCEALDEHGAEQAARAEMVDAALWTFAQFEAWFSVPAESCRTA